MANALHSRLLSLCIGIVLMTTAWGQIDFLDFDASLADCIQTHTNGTQTVRQYDTCVSFCCGGEIYLKRTNITCCGSEQLGGPYNTWYQFCCEWWTGAGKGHRNPNPGRSSGISCCGAHTIKWGPQQCCQGYPGAPNVYNVGKDICCQPSGQVASVQHLFGLNLQANRNRAKCCGERRAYDSLTQACPCNDGQVLNVSESQAMCCRTPEGFPTPYIPESQICCNGDVGDKSQSFCCGDRGVGILGEQVCCSGNLVEVKPKNTNLTACCNNVPYDPNLDVCCSDKVIEIEDDANLCCGDKAYSATKSVCCDNQLWSVDSQGTECCGSSAFFPDKGSFCCQGVVQIETDVGGDACCGEETSRHYYFKDTNEFICCSGSLLFKRVGTTCCGDNAYFPETSFCCDGQISPLSQGDSCCNGKPYNATTTSSGSRSICCDNGPFGPFKTPKCCNGEGYDIQGGTVCCGDTVYGKYQWPSCCVTVGYDAKTHVCCGANVQPIPSNDNGDGQGGCCDSIAINTKTQLCCGGENTTIPAGIPRSVAQCCHFSIFRNDTQLCCSGVIHEKTNPFATECCGTTAYNITENICCDLQDGFGPTLHNFTYGERNTGCCDATIYNQTEEICCDGFLEKKPFKEAGCCAGISYNIEEEVCCENNLLELGKVNYRRAQCCGGKCMNRARQFCCQNNVYSKTTNKRTTMECKEF